jgi:hypothetical protein
VHIYELIFLLSEIKQGFAQRGKGHRFDAVLQRESLLCGIDDDAPLRRAANRSSKTAAFSSDEIE